MSFDLFKKIIFGSSNRDRHNFSSGSGIVIQEKTFYNKWILGFFDVR